MSTLPAHFFEQGVDEEEQAKLSRVRSTRLRTDIDVLRCLPALFERGVPHALVITREVIDELPGGTRWYAEQLFEWAKGMGFIPEYVPKSFFPGIADALDSADRRLYLQAFALGCDAFLTTDYKTIVKRRDCLPRAGTRVLTPIEYWDGIKPWAGLFFSAP